MKLHYTKILLFFLPLNIFVSSSYAPNKNKPCITPHEPTTISRVLSECNIDTSIYDDEDMKSVKENFDRQTSQRFEEYEERMKDKRQKCKEQCDKDIEQIVVKDKMEKSLEEKVEKVCLKCGCALGGGIAPVWGLISGLGHYAWTQYVSSKVLEESLKKGLEVGLAQIMKFTTKLQAGAKLPDIAATQLLSSGNFSNNVTLFDIVQYINNTMYDALEAAEYNQFCGVISSMANKKPITAFNVTYREYSVAVTEAVTEGKTNAINALTPTTNALTTAIIASVVAIVVIVLVMIIIYLILRYRRKKKMKKKQQYTKLLKE